jgi:integrase
MQGISVYQRKGRGTWYVAYDCPNRLRRVNESSGYRLDDARGKVNAYAYAREKSASGIAHGVDRHQERWSAWVEPWLRERYRHQPKTLTSYLGAWKHLSFFLHERKVFFPHLLTYEHVVGFVHWREQQVKRTSKRKVSRNTALHNVKALSSIMRRAVRMGYSQGNPCREMGDDVTADPAPLKPEFTDQQIAQVRAELARRDGIGRPADWMAIAFEIAIHHGCRLSATQIPMERIDFTRGTITFVEKGTRGKAAVFTVPMHPELRPLLERLRGEGRTVTCQLPRFASRNFGRVMRAIGLPHSFHCTRVTVVTRMARQGVPIQQAMAYVHHGDETIHKVYQRLGAQDLLACHQALSFSSAASCSPQSRGARPSTSPPSPASSSDR